MHTPTVDAACSSAAPLPGNRTELRHAALQALLISEPDAKCDAVASLWALVSAGDCELDPEAVLNGLASAGMASASLPGRPALPRLIAPSQVPQRSVHTPEGRAALLHAICHIEFNAINLALDAVWRFKSMPRGFYHDWLRVAAEEAAHFLLLRGLLRQMPRADSPFSTWDYGDFDAHDGLWSMCEKTATDITARMALVPRTLEARGLDATPLIQAKLRKVGTADALATVDALDIILRDEVGHVAIGNHWYRWLCDRQQLEPVSHYRTLSRQYSAPRLKPPFNEEARRRAGFTPLELDYLHGT